MNQLLTASNIHKNYTQGDSTLRILKGVSLGVSAGEFLIVHGPSGAGKSTLLHIIGLLDAPSAGEISYNGGIASALTDKEKSFIRNRRFGFVFQMYHLLPEFSLIENVLLPSFVFSGTLWKQRSRALKLLEKLSLAHRLDHPVTKLSGGEMQRACIARALINSPEILFCDEPTGNLDADSASEVWTMLKNINTDEGVTIIAVSHDDRALRYGSRVIRIQDGTIV